MGFDARQTLSCCLKDRRRGIQRPVGVEIRPYWQPAREWKLDLYLGETESCHRHVSFKKDSSIHMEHRAFITLISAL
jgi:hypothetical protein